MKITINDLITKESTERKNLKYVDSSKRALRLFLEKEILAQTQNEFSTCDITTPLTPHDYREIEFPLYPRKFPLLPLEVLKNQTDIIKNSMIIIRENHFSLHNDLIQNNNHYLNENITDLKCQNFIDKEEQDVLLWHESSSICDTASIEGSLSGESISKVPFFRSNNVDELTSGQSWWKRKRGIICCCIG